MTAWTVAPEDAATRLDQYLVKQLGISRSEAQRLIESGWATLDGKTAKANHKLRPGEQVDAERPDPVATKLIPEAIPLDIVFEDADLLVINKPRGMVVHPAPGAEHATLVHAV